MKTTDEQNGQTTGHTFGDHVRVSGRRTYDWEKERQ